MPLVTEVTLIGIERIPTSAAPRMADRSALEESQGSIRGALALILVFPGAGALESSLHPVGWYEFGIVR
jgi:hypothetical protein